MCISLKPSSDKIMSISITPKSFLVSLGNPLLPLPASCHLMQIVDSLEKTLMLGGIWGQEEKGTTESEMSGWYHRLDGRESE